MAIDKRISYRRNFRGGGMDMGNTKSQARSASMANTPSRNTSSGTGGSSGNIGGGGGGQGSKYRQYSPPTRPTYTSANIDSKPVTGADYRRSKKEFIDKFNQDRARDFKPTGFRRTYKPIGLDRFGSSNQLGAKGGLGNLFKTLFGFATGIPIGLFNKGKSGITSINNALGDFREKFTGYRTQQEYDDARQQRIDLNRINTIQNTLDTKYADGDYSMTDLDERLAALQQGLGIVPNTAAQNAQQFLDFSNQPELSYEGIKSLAQPQVFNFNKIGEKLNRDMSYYSPDVGELVAELTDKQKRFIDSKKFPLQENLISPKSVYDTITNPDLGIYDTGTFGFGAQEPTTEEEYNNYLRSLGLTQTI